MTHRRSPDAPVEDPGGIWQALAAPTVHPDNPSKDALLILRIDGSVASVDGAPVEWLERRALDLPLEDAVRTVLVDLLARTSREESAFRLVETTVAGSRVRLAILVSSALPVRRSLVRPTDLLMRTMDVFIAQARSASVELRVRQGGDLPPVIRGDRDKLAWALATLLGNAIRIVRDASGPEHPMVEIGLEYDSTTW